MRHFLFVGCLLLTGVANAASVTVDFEEQAINLAPIPDLVISQGISLTSTSNFLIRENQSAGFDTKVLFYGSTFDLLIEDSSGSQFSLHQFDFGRTATAIRENITVTGYFVGGGTVSLNILTTNQSLQTVLFGDEWNNLDHVTVGGGSALAQANGIDNIVLSTVPVPAAVWLFASGLGLLGWLRRRRTA